VEEGTVEQTCGKKKKPVKPGEHVLCGCGFWIEDGVSGGLGIPGLVAAGSIVAGGGIIGGAAAGGGFGSNNESPSK
jgi:hypothetical protein